jgi:two-component system, NarL family, response regulator FusR
LHAEKCLQAGAHGYLMKNQPAEVLIGAIRTLVGGDLFVSKHMRTHLLRGLMQGPTAKSSPNPTPTPTLLTRTEWLVLELIGMGFSSRSIADKLKRSIKTISAHRANIQHKLGLPDNAALMHYAIQYSQSAPALTHPTETA